MGPVAHRDPANMRVERATASFRTLACLGGEAGGCGGGGFDPARVSQVRSVAIGTTCLCRRGLLERPLDRGPGSRVARLRSVLFRTPNRNQFAAWIAAERRIVRVLRHLQRR